MEAKTQQCPECRREVPANWVIPFTQIFSQKEKAHCQTCLDRIVGPRGEPLLPRTYGTNFTE